MNRQAQYIRLMPLPVDRTSEYLVVQIPMDDMSKHKPSTAMTQVAWESKLHSVVR